MEISCSVTAAKTKELRQQLRKPFRMFIRRDHIKKHTVCI